MLVSSLPCCGHAQWLGFAGGSIVLQLGFWGQLILLCILAISTVFGDFAPCSPSLSGKYDVGIMVPLFLAVWRCLVFATHKVVMVTLRAWLLCSGLRYLSRHLPQAHILLMSLKLNIIIVLTCTCNVTESHYTTAKWGSNVLQLANYRQMLPYSHPTDMPTSLLQPLYSGQNRSSV